MDVSRKERAYDWSLEKCVGHPRLIPSGAPRNRQTDALSPCLATANHFFNLGKHTHTHTTNMVTLTCRQKKKKKPSFRFLPSYSQYFIRNRENIPISSFLSCCLGFSLFDFPFMPNVEEVLFCSNSQPKTEAMPVASCLCNALPPLPGCTL